MTADTLLQKEYELGFTYTRSTGPIVGKFLTGLKNREIFGVRSSDGRVVVPPMEYDPQTGEAVTDFVQVSDAGFVESWCWVSDPRSSHPSVIPFAWAMIRLDGADTSMIHFIITDQPDQLKSGVRVKACWSDSPMGFITDIRCFRMSDDG